MTFRLYSCLGPLLAVAACGGGAAVTGAPGPDADVVDAGLADAATADAEFDAGIDASANDLPTISIISDQTTQFAAVGPIAFVVEDSQTPVEALLVTATSSDTTVLPNENILLEGTGMIRTATLTPGASGTSTITITVNDGTTNAFRSFLLEVTNTAPTAAPDDYATIGNTALDVPLNLGVLANDSDDENDAIVVIADDIVSAMGGSVSLASDGSFSYLPPVGVRDATDSFDYQVTDGFASSVGTASVALTEMVWYVDSTVPVSGDGRSTLPVQTLPEAQAGSAENDIIFVAGETYTTGITLKEGQHLIGAPVGLTVAGIERIAPSAIRPVISDAAAAGVRLAATNEIRGLDIEDTAGDGIVGNAIANIVIDDVNLADTGGQGIDLGNPNAVAPISIAILNTTIIGATDFSNTPIGIDVQISGTSAGQADVLISNTSIRQVPVGILLAARGETGTGLAGANVLRVVSTSISDFDDDGIQIEPDDTAASNFEVSATTIDGINLLMTATPVRSIDVRVRTGAGAATTLLLSENIISDSDLACISVLGSSDNGGGTVTALLQNNSLVGCGEEGISIAPDDEILISATLDGNTVTGSGAPSSFEFRTGTAHRLDLNLVGNDDAQGFRLERGAVGVLNLAGALGVGASFDDDNGNIANNGNTSAGGAPTIVIASEAAPLQINIVDPATVASP